MRLLNSNTLKFEFFLEGKCPPYLILSHRWENKETSYQDFQQQIEASHAHSMLLTLDESHRSNQGVRKVLQFCEVARNNKADYVWVDTCCIDKTSSAELQEAINSMFRWYENSRCCFVYLSDVRLGKHRKTESSVKQNRSWFEQHIQPQLEASRWFTRGWTLQEMLAPKKLIFVDAEWKIIDGRSGLAEILEKVTGVKQSYYGNKTRIHLATVAERMSWLVCRETARPEDLAYCMLGIFDINMTMLYGEGEKAFKRLQHEIVANIDDETIFAWTAVPQPVTEEANIDTEDDLNAAKALVLVSNLTCDVDALEEHSTVQQQMTEEEEDDDDDDSQVEESDSSAEVDIGGYWTDESDEKEERRKQIFLPPKRLYGMLAPHPRCFSAFRFTDIRINLLYRREPYRMTNRGLEIEVYDKLIRQFNNELDILLNCIVRDGRRVGIRLRQIGKERWLRIVDREITTYTPEEIILPRDKEAEFRGAAGQENAILEAMAGVEGREARLQTRGRFKLYIG